MFNNNMKNNCCHNLGWQNQTFQTQNFDEFGFNQGWQEPWGEFGWQNENWGCRQNRCPHAPKCNCGRCWEMPTFCPPRCNRNDCINIAIPKCAIYFLAGCYFCNNCRK